MAAEDYRFIVRDLEKVYGKANSNGFGSAVFFEEMPENLSSGEVALKHYRVFIGAKWNSETESRWLSGWKNVYVRETGKNPDILTEFGQITDSRAKLAVPLLTELVGNAEPGRKALAAAFDHPLVAELTVNLVGDGEAFSGIMITGVFTFKKVCSVICIMD